MNATNAANEVSNSAAAQMKNEEMKLARMLKELQSDMADLVAAGEMTEQEANEWVNHKADQWANGLN